MPYLIDKAVLKAVFDSDETGLIFFLLPVKKIKCGKKKKNATIVKCQNVVNCFDVLIQMEVKTKFCWLLVRVGKLQCFKNVKSLFV